jgi:hypothetical protein
MDAIHIEVRHLDTWSLADARLKLEEKSLLLKKITHELEFANLPMCSDCA